MAEFQFNPLGEEFARDPYPTYAAMRAMNAPFYYADVDTWMLTKMSDVERVVLDKSMVRQHDDLLSDEEKLAQQRKMNWHAMPFHERFVQTNLLESEGETHDRLRKVVFREFTPAAMLKFREEIQRFVDNLLDELSDRDEIDFVSDFAVHIPGHVIGKVLGVPDEDCPLLRTWSENVVRFFDVGRGEEDKRIAEQSTKEFYEYLSDLVKEGNGRKHSDLMTRLLEAKQSGEISEDEMIATAMLILMAGHGSTIDVLGSGMHALLKFPDEHRRLRDDPGLMKTAVQEMFRYESPLPYFHRFATEDCDVAGQAFKAGTRFGVLYGAANRDPERFDDPDRFDAGRNPNRHKAFGGGTHFCLGNHLARLDMDVIFSTLNARFKRIELSGETPVYKRGLSVRGPETLKLAWRAN